MVTMSTVQPAGRFGAVEPDETGRINSFIEKPEGDGRWVNGGFMMCEPTIFDYLSDDQTILERKPLENIAKDGGLAAYKHSGFWKCMDTQRDQFALNQLIQENKAPWIRWNEKYQKTDQKEAVCA